MQLDLLTRETQELALGAWHVPNWLPLDEQVDLIENLRNWCAKGFWTPQMPNGTPMNHPLCGLGLNWKPYEYFHTDRPFPFKLEILAKRAVEETLPDLLSGFVPDVAIVNYFPPKSSLGMHQDRSEHHTLQQSGSPIVTLSLGDSALFRLGNIQNNGRPYDDIELKSGDLLVMGGPSRMRFHGVIKIYDRTTPHGLEMKPGRLSVTIRQA